MKLYQCIKYQFIEKDKLLTSSVPVVVKVDLESNQLCVCTLDLLKTLQCVKLDQTPTFVSRLMVLACKYQEYGSIKKFQLHLHKKDVEEIAQTIKHLFSVNWRMKDYENTNIYSQKILECTQIEERSTQRTDYSSLSKKTLCQSDSFDTKSSQTDVASFTEYDLKELLNNKEFVDLVNEMGSQFICQLHACL